LRIEKSISQLKIGNHAIKIETRRRKSEHKLEVCASLVKFQVRRRNSGFVTQNPDFVIGFRKTVLKTVFRHCGKDL